MKTDQEIDSLQGDLKAKGVKYCIGAYVDIHGVPKGKFVPIDHFKHFAHGSELYTGYALDGLGQSPNDDEIASVPDLDSITILPWNTEVAWMPADFVPKGEGTRHHRKSTGIDQGDLQKNQSLARIIFRLLVSRPHPNSSPGREQNQK